MSAEEVVSQGAVELREDAPLKSGTTRSATGAARYIAGCFTALTLAITVALLAQLYSGHYQVVPHGAVSTTGDFCSAVGVHALREGGGAADGASGAALCLALTRPERIGLDSSVHLAPPERDVAVSLNDGALTQEWRSARVGVQEGSRRAADAGRMGRGAPERSATAETGGRVGVRARALRPAAVVELTGAHHIQNGGVSGRVDERLARISHHIANEYQPRFHGIEGAAVDGGWRLYAPGDETRKWSQLWRSDEFVRFHGIEGAAVDGGWRLYAPGDETRKWSQLWRSDEFVRFHGIEGAAVDGGWRLYAPGDETARALNALPAEEDDRFVARVASVLQTRKRDTRGTGTGVAVIDSEDVYLSLVIGSPSATEEALTPAMLVEDDVCGRRFVLAAGEWPALLQVASRLRRSSLRAAVESYRLLACCDRVLLEESAPAAARASLFREASLESASEAAVNVVAQTGDRLRAHADSRGRGVASRF